jgi:hypothetical protein
MRCTPNRNHRRVRWITLGARVIARRRLTDFLARHYGNYPSRGVQHPLTCSTFEISAPSSKARIPPVEPSLIRVPAVSDESNPTPPGLDRVWAALDREGYALTNDRAIGLPDKFRNYFRETYFNDSVLDHDPRDQPIDRKRARDVIRYHWRDADLDLTEHGTITITDRAEIPGKRDHSRVMLLDNPQAKELIRTLLHLVPAERRQPDGTFGVNLFRTFTNVVSKLHRDDEQFVMTYLLDRVGSGAETYLYERGDVTEDGQAIADAKPVLRHQLEPGEIIIFDDERFRHGATPLEAPSGEMTQRDALVCTVDYRETYLSASAAR